MQCNSDKMFNKNVFAALVLVSVHVTKGVIDNGSQPNTITPVEETKNVSHGERTGRLLHKECTNLLSSKCLKIHVLSFLEELSSREELSLLPGLSIIKENLTSSNPSPEEMAAELSRQFPGKPEEKLNRFLLYRLQDYLDGHSLRYKLLDPQTTKEAMDMAKGDRESVGRKSGGGGGLGGGKGGGGGALLAAAMMMKGNIRYFTWITIRCSVFKRLFPSQYRKCESHQIFHDSYTILKSHESTNR